MTAYEVAEKAAAAAKGVRIAFGLPNSTGKLDEYNEIDAPSLTVFLLIAVVLTVGAAIGLASI